MEQLCVPKAVILPCPLAVQAAPEAIPFKSAVEMQPRFLPLPCPIMPLDNGKASDRCTQQGRNNGQQTRSMGTLGSGVTAKRFEQRDVPESRFKIKCSRMGRAGSVIGGVVIFEGKGKKGRCLACNQPVGNFDDHKVTAKHQENAKMMVGIMSEAQ